MQNKVKNRVKFFLIGFVIGVFLTASAGLVCYKAVKVIKDPAKRQAIKKKIKNLGSIFKAKPKLTVEDFKVPMEAVNGKSFGKNNHLAFELFRGGIFVIDGKSGYALQHSPSYRDSAFIRSTKSLPKTYKISVVVGGIDYGLEKISGLEPDPEYPEGPQNENGCYLLAITDEVPKGHHTNIWWHQHRKVVIDVDNNAWGHGMPNPIFMVYFDGENKLTSFDGAGNGWTKSWQKAVTYDPGAWYKVEIEKTKSEFVMSIYDEKGKLLKSASVNLKNVWHEGGPGGDYFVIGDPHENYYQGSMKIRSIAVTPGAK